MFLLEIRIDATVFFADPNHITNCRRLGPDTIVYSYRSLMHQTLMMKFCPRQRFLRTVFMSSIVCTEHCSCTTVNTSTCYKTVQKITDRNIHFWGEGVRSSARVFGSFPAKRALGGNVSDSFAVKFALSAYV